MGSVRNDIGKEPVHTLHKRRLKENKRDLILKKKINNAGLVGHIFFSGTLEDRFNSLEVIGEEKLLCDLNFLIYPVGCKVGSGTS